MQPPLPPDREGRAAAIWLLANAGMVFLMALIGAITRLTESGLSITVWQPLTGWRWPESPEAWQAAFELYRQTPQYREVFAGIDLEAFKQIFFWEWLHRLWGRLIGLTFAVPFAVLLWRRLIPRRLIGVGFGFLVLGGIQGAVGWYMVESGLVDRPSVSHLRLALHLSLALAILALLVLVGIREWRGPTTQAAPPPGFAGHIAVVAGALGLTIVWGAFVAGLDAGLLYGTFPLMGDRLVPAEIGFLSPWWRNAIDNGAAVQFIHRCLGIASLVAVGSIWWRFRRAVGPGRVWLDAMLALASVQVALGIATVLTGVALPLAVAHQAGAMLLLAATAAALATISMPRRAVGSVIISSLAQARATA